MSNNNKNEEKSVCEGKIHCAPCQTGTMNLVIGGGVATYGTTLALTMGYVCPVCIFAAPLFLGVGAFQKYRFLKRSKKETQENAQD